MSKMTEVKPATSDPAGPNDRGKMVVAKVPQGYDTRINIRLVPGREIPFTPDILGCQPRQGAPRRDAVTVALPESLGSKLKDANNRVIDWLAQNTANAQLFLARPVEALVRAGVDLTRTEQKILDRTHRAAHEARMIAPGVKVADLSALAYPTGRVGEIKLGAPTKDRRGKGCGPSPKGKE